MNNDIRWKQRFSNYKNYKKTTSQLTEFIEKGELNKFEVQDLIKCFEYTSIIKKLYSKLEELE